MTENLEKALRKVTELRSKSGLLWKTASEGMTNVGKRQTEAGGTGSTTAKEKAFLSELKKLLEGVQQHIT